jgi:hypothetical protein
MAALSNRIADPQGARSALQTLSAHPDEPDQWLAPSKSLKIAENRRELRKSG